MGTHGDADEQVARRTAVFARAALAAQGDRLAVIDARGDVDGDLPLPPHTPAAAAGFAGRVDELARAAALGAGGGGGEGKGPPAPLNAHGAGAAAVGADLCGGTRLTAAAPAGVKVKVYGVEKAKRLWDKNQFGTEGRVLLLFKDIPTCYKLYEQGVPMNYIQIGGVAKTADRKVILQAVSLNESEMELLGKFHQNGCEVAIQIVPEDTRLSYEEIVKKYKEK